MNSLELCERVVRSLDKHKAGNISAIGVSDLTIVTDYFVVAGGTSANHVRSLADYLEDELAAEGVITLRTEGYNEAKWVLLDFGGVVVHLFQPETREYYDLERLWKDGQQVDILPWTTED
ncbi:MAG: ribosome silencing factor [Clostridia bacterium]|nr:ribosome silencing factor [Clostridia bacterium]